MCKEFLDIKNHPFERNPEIFTDFRFPHSLKNILSELNVTENDESHELYALLSEEQLVFHNPVYTIRVNIEIIDSIKEFVKNYFEGFKLHINPKLILLSEDDTIGLSGWFLTEEEKANLPSRNLYLEYPWEWFFCCETTGYCSHSLQ